MLETTAGGSVSGLMHLLSQPIEDGRVHELRDIAIQDRDFPNDRCRDEHELLGWSQKNRFDFGYQSPVHAGHLEFVFEIRRRPQSAQNYPRLMFVDKISQQAGKSVHLNIGAVTQNLPCHFDTLDKTEKRALSATVCDAQDNLIKQRGCTSDNILVPASQGIEGSRINCLDHGLFRLQQMKMHHSGAIVPQ